MKQVIEHTWSMGLYKDWLGSGVAWQLANDQDIDIKISPSYGAFDIMINREISSYKWMDSIKSQQSLWGKVKHLMPIDIIYKFEQTARTRTLWVDERLPLVDSAMLTLLAVYLRLNRG